MSCHPLGNLNPADKSRPGGVDGTQTYWFKIPGDPNAQPLRDRISWEMVAKAGVPQGRLSQGTWPGGNPGKKFLGLMAEKIP